MRNSKLFIVSIFIIASILLVLDLPGKLNFHSLKLPFVSKNSKIANFSYDPSNINFNIGNIKIHKDLSFKLGLDLQGGTQLVYRVNMKDVKVSERKDAFESARNVIERRINLLGVSEPSIQTIKLGDDYRIIVELPGMSNVSDAINLIGQTAVLTFWEGGKDKSVNQPSDYLSSALGQIVGGKAVKTSLTGKDLQKASVVFDRTTGKPQVQLQFTGQGGKYFADITKRNIGKVVAIVLDSQVVSAPVVQAEIANGTAVITGSFTPEVANKFYS